VKEVIGDVIRGLERDRPGTEKTTLPDDPQFRRQEAAIQQVASERLQRERLQAVERDMVRDLNREKNSGRLTRLHDDRQTARLKSGSLPER
jgi:hypothetical protein